MKNGLSIFNRFAVGLIRDDGCVCGPSDGDDMICPAGCRTSSYMHRDALAGVSIGNSAGTQDSGVGLGILQLPPGSLPPDPGCGRANRELRPATRSDFAYFRSQKLSESPSQKIKS